MNGDSARRGVSRIVGNFVNPFVGAVDVDAVLERVDLDDALERVDVDRLLERIDANGLLARVDIDELIARVEINGVLDRVDVDRLLDRIDVNALLDRVDVDRLMGRADIAELVGRAKIGNVVTDSASTAATSVLDFGRGRLAGFDAITTSIVRRIFGRHPAKPSYDDGLIAAKPAGPFTRLIAYVLDAGLITALFGLGLFLVTYLVNLFFDSTFDPTNNGGPWWAAAAAVFAGLYWWVGLAVTGRTVGKAFLGLRVVDRSGEPVGARAALIRVLVFPFSFILGIGFVGIVVGRDRRAMHDAAAHTVEVYDWGDRPARLPNSFLRWLGPRPRRADDIRADETGE